MLGKRACIVIPAAATLLFLLASASYAQDTPNQPELGKGILSLGKPLDHTETVGGPGDPADWFRFYVVPRGSQQNRRLVHFALDNLSADADLVLLELPTRRPIPMDNQKGDRSEFMSRNLKTGRSYALGVVARGGETSYQLDVAY